MHKPEEVESPAAAATTECEKEKGKTTSTSKSCPTPETVKRQPDHSEAQSCLTFVSCWCVNHTYIVFVPPLVSLCDGADH